MRISSKSIRLRNGQSQRLARSIFANMTTHSSLVISPITFSSAVLRSLERCSSCRCALRLPTSPNETLHISFLPLFARSMRTSLTGHKETPTHSSSLECDSHMCKKRSRPTYLPEFDRISSITNRPACSIACSTTIDVHNGFTCTLANVDGRYLLLISFMEIVPREGTWLCFLVACDE